MNWNDVVNAAKALIEYTGTDARIQALNSAVKTKVLNSHSWEKFMVEESVTYPASSSYLELDTNDYNHIYRVVAIKKQDADVQPPEWAEPGEYYRLLAQNYDLQSAVTHWTQMNTKLYLLGQPGSATNLDLIFSRSAANVGWGAIPEDFLDYASVILARRLTSMKTESPDGRIFLSPTYRALVDLEKDTLKQLKDVEHRQPGRDYKVRDDEMRRIRVEGYDY